MSSEPKNTVEVDPRELAGIVNELDAVVATASEIAEWEGGLTDSAEAIRRARDILKSWL